jgi:hypothetical protein
LYEKAMIQAANLDTMKSGNLKGARALPLLKKKTAPFMAQSGAGSAG